MSGASSAISAAQAERVLGRTRCGRRARAPPPPRGRAARRRAASAAPGPPPASRASRRTVHGSTARPRAAVGSPKTARSAPTRRSAAIASWVPAPMAGALHGRDHRDRDRDDPLQHRRRGRRGSPRRRRCRGRRPSRRRSPRPVSTTTRVPPATASSRAACRSRQWAVLSALRRSCAGDPQLGHGAVGVGLDHEAAVCPRASA